MFGQSSFKEIGWNWWFALYQKNQKISIVVNDLNTYYKCLADTSEYQFQLWHI